MSDAIQKLQEVIDNYLKAGPCTILEAGCGSMSKVQLNSDIYLVGMDISEKQLARNNYLHEKILGDLHTYPIPSKKFDIIICWDVLEHLDRPRLVIENFLTACKPGGLIILAFPNLFSVKGVITKLTPHVFHVWYYKYILGDRDAGKDDQPPFVTKLRLAMSYPAIRRFVQARGATVELLAFRECNDMKTARSRFAIINALIGTASAITKALTYGRADAADSDCILVVRAGYNS